MPKVPPPHQHQLPLAQAIEDLEKAGRSVQMRVRRFLAGLGYTSLLLILVIFVTCVVTLRFYGLPTPIRDYLLKELATRGITASVDRLVLDPTGGIVAERVSVYRTPTRNDLLLQVDRVRIGLAWFSWWRGRTRSFVQSASVSNATIKYPITPKSTVEVTQVNATVEFEQGGMQVRSARARFLNLDLDLRGHIATNGQATQEKRTDEQNERIDRIWNQILRTSDGFYTDHPFRVQADFDVATANFSKATLHAAIQARMFRWRGALVDAFSLQASYEEQILHLTDFRLKLVRGELELTGEANLQNKTAHAEFYSNLDFTPLAAALGGALGSPQGERVQDAVSKLSFTELPVISARAQVGWADPTPVINLQADIDWRRFTYAQTAFDSLTIPIAYDGARVFIPDAEIVAQQGQVKLEVLYDRNKPEIKGQFESSLDPTVLKGVFGPKSDLFLDSVHFTNGGPHLKFNLRGQSASPQDWLVTGKISAQNFSYKKVNIDSLETDCTYTNQEVDAPNLVVKRKEGQITGGVRENFADRWVRLTNFQTNVLVQEVATVLGDKFASYVKPYPMDRPPALKVDGLVDLNDKKETLNTDLKVQMTLQGNLMYVLYNKYKFTLANPIGELTIKDRDLNVHIQDGHLYAGPVVGNIYVKLVKTPAEKSDYTLKLGLRGGDFKQMMSELFNNDKTSGKFDFDVGISGKLGDLSSINGGGDLSVDDGYLMNIPLMSGLTFIIDNLIPGFALGKADHAKANFALGNGAISTKDLSISSAIFSMLGSGNYNYVHDDVDMDMRVNVSGPIGWVTGFLSKIFQYHGKGSLKDVKWAPKILGD